MWSTELMSEQKNMAYFSENSLTWSLFQALKDWEEDEVEGLLSLCPSSSHPFLK